MPLGIAAAVAIAGFAFAGTANADTDVQGENNLTVTLNIGANTVNDGTSGYNATNHGTVKVINSSGQTQNAAPGDEFAVYTEVSGAGITQDMLNTFPGNGMVKNGLDDVTTPVFLLPPSTIGANCPAASSACVTHALPRTNGMSDPANIVAGTASQFQITHNYTSKTLPFDIRVDSRTAGTHALTGPVTFVTEVVELDSTGHLVRILGGASATTNLGNPSAPVINTAPNAIVDQPYDFQLVNLGFPPVPQAFPGAGGGAPGGINYTCTYVENNHTHTQTCTAGWRVWAHNPDGSIYLLKPFLDTNGHWTYYLPYNFDPSLPVSPPTPQNGSFFLDTATGHLYANEYQQAQANGAPTTYVLEVNNGIGGASHDDTLGGNLFAGVAPIHLHDVTGTLTVATRFSDLDTSNVFYKAIQLLANDGIVEGYADGTFRPSVAVSRSQFAHMLAEYLNFAIETSPSPNGYSFPTHIGTGACTTNRPSAFPDVPNTSAFCAEIRDLSEAGVIHGYKSGLFAPAQGIARQELSGLLWRGHEYYLGHSLNADGDLPCSGSPFPDVSTSDVFCGDISWLKSHGITHGYTDGGYHPFSSVTRGETAQFVFNLGSYDITDFQYLKPVVG